VVAVSFSVQVKRQRAKGKSEVWNSIRLYCQRDGDPLRKSRARNCDDVRTHGGGDSIFAADEVSIWLQVCDLGVCYLAPYI